MAKKKQSKQTAAQNSTATASELRTVAIEQITPSPFQTRRDFPKAEIDDLAESIKAHGLIQAPVVREKAGYRSPLVPRYELVVGERRLRAAKKAGLQEIRVQIRQFDDRQVRETIVAENLQRKDLNPIEEARAFRAILDAGDAPGPTELARRLGLSQGHVSNRLALLELPHVWQKRIISREITPTHARVLVPYKGSPELLATIDKKFRKQDYEANLESFEETVVWAIEQVTKPMKGTVYDFKLGTRMSVFEPTDKEREELDLIEVQHRWEKKPELRARNLKLWERLQQQHAKRCLERREAKAKGKPPSSGDGKPKKRKPTPAQVARLERERAEQFQRRLWQWYVDWLRYLVAQKVRSEMAGEATLVILLALAGHWDYKQFLATGTYRFHDADWLAESARAKNLAWRQDVIGRLTHIEDPDSEVGLWELAAEAAARVFYAEGPTPLVPDTDVVKMVKYLEIDVRAAWLDGQAGPLSERYWELHNREQLLDLGKELKVDLPAGAKKGELVKAFLAKIPGPKDKEVGIDLPKELKQIKRPK